MYFSNNQQLIGEAAPWLVLNAGFLLAHGKEMGAVNGELPFVN
jgi:hypothetical protein